MNNDTIEIVITVKKDDLQKAIDKLGITEYHYKNNKVLVDMTASFNQAMDDMTKKGSNGDEVF